MPLQRFIGQHGTIDARLRQLMRLLHAVELKSPYDYAYPLRVSTSYDGILEMDWPTWKSAECRGGGAEIVAFDADDTEGAGDAQPAWYFFGHRGVRLLRAIQTVLPPDVSLHVTRSEAVLVGPDGLWMVQNPEIESENIAFPSKETYQVASLPTGHMALAGTQHAKIAFLASPIGQRIRTSWTLSDAVIPHAGAGAGTVVFQGDGQAVLCAICPDLRILGVWRNAIC